MHSLLSRKQHSRHIPLTTDIHSHLLPALDDGVKTVGEAKKIIDQFVQLGYSKLVTTPHIMNGHYNNNPEIIGEKLNLLKEHLKGVKITLEAAAEYYLDESVLKKIHSDEPLMTFGDAYLLFETCFINPPYFLDDFITMALQKGYKPVLAHPERYQYLIADFRKAEDLRNRNVLFQISIPSIAGSYTQPVKKMACRFIDKGWVDFLGSDCHGQQHMDILTSTLKSRIFKKALNLPLLNRNI